jgi:hypothetical protein
MTDMHAGLAQFRDELRDAVAHDLDDRGLRDGRGDRALRVALPTAAAAGAAALALALTGGSPAPSADAAIMRHVVAALTGPAATILHERALVTSGSTTAPYELWVESDPPHAYRVIKWGHEGTGSGGTTTDPAGELRSLVASGQAHVDTSTTVAGVPAYKLSVSGASDRFLNGTAYVARSNYYPLEIDTTGNGGERIVVQRYEYLPATPANLALLK